MAKVGEARGKITKYSLIPLYLEDDALTLYLEMNEREQTDVKRIEDRLKEAFTEGVFVSYNRIHWAGQTVNVDANEIRRLASLSGFAGEGLETAVKLAFVNGFPEDVSVALQQLLNVVGTDMDEIISKARVLTTNRATGFEAAVIKEKVGEEWLRPSAGGRTPSSRKSENRTFRGKCFKCQGPHMVRDCKADVTCYRCRKLGYVARYCDQGNEGGRVTTGAPDTTDNRGCD